MVHLNNLFVVCMIVCFSATNYVVASENNEDECPTFDFIINQSVQYVKKVLTEGLPSMNIPKVDPIKFSILPLILPFKDAQGLMLLTNFKFDGYGSTLRLLKGSVALPGNMDIELKIDRISLGTGYSGKLTLFSLLKLHGKGKLSLEFKDFGIEMSIKFRAFRLPLLIEQLDVKLLFPTMSARITGLFNDENMSSIITDQINDTVDALFQQEGGSINTAIQEALTSLVETTLNPLLADITWEKILGDLFEHGDFPSILISLIKPLRLELINIINIVTPSTTDPNIAKLYADYIRDEL